MNDLNNYHGEYLQFISISITSEDHEVSLRISKRFKNLCKAWRVSLVESKSARSGDVMNRHLSLKQIAYSHSIIIFQESVRMICEHETNPLGILVEIDSLRVSPKDRNAL